MTKSFYILVILFLAFSLTYCQNGNNKGKTTSEDSPSEMQSLNPTPLEKGCYAYHRNGDTILFKIGKTGDTITGNLTYVLKEKDRNEGIFEGRLKGDRLIGDYSFQSEGQKSSRQAIFLLKDDKLIEGYGEIESEKNDAVKYENIDALTYNYTMPLVKTSCQ